MIDQRLFTEAKAARWALILTIALDIGTGIILIAQAALLSQVINQVFLEDAALNDVAGLILALAGVIVLRAVFAWGGQVAAWHVAIQVKTDLRRRLLAHLLALGPAYTQGERSGELVNTVTEGVEALDAYFRDYLPGVFLALLVPLLILVAVFTIDALTGIVLLLTAPLIPFFMVLIGRAAGAVARRQYEAMSLMSAHFLDVMQGLTTLKLFNRSRHQIDTIGRITDQFRQATMGVLRVAFLSALTLELLATLSVALVAVQIGVRLLHGGLAFMQALFLLVIAPDYYLPLRALGVKFHAGIEGAAAARRIFALLGTPDNNPLHQPAADTSPVYGGVHPSAQAVRGSTSTIQSSFQHDDSIDSERSSTAKTAPSPPAGRDGAGSTYTIYLDNLTYAYADGERPALNGLTFTIPHGKRVALVGATGSGKSTLAALLLRFIEPQGGEIWVNDMRLADIAPDVWRHSVAWVPQMPYLFNTTVKENIRLGLPDAADDAIFAAARQAGAHDFITALPQGYNTIVGERGARLSGGQAQRIAIARAFLKNAPLLILDEATANLDPETEAIIVDSLSRLMRNRTALVIAHRLNTVFESDHIVVFAAGRVAQQGTHAELIAQTGLYRDLVTAYLF